MFAEYLTQDEQQALLKLMAFIIAADGEVKPEEISYLDSVANSFGKSATGIFHDIEGVELRSICDAFTREKAKRIALVEVVSSAMSDGVMHPAELKGIEAIGTIMAVEPNAVDAMLQWVKTGIEWRDEGERLLGLAPPARA